MKITNKKMIVFDKDNTITKAKKPMETSMSLLFSKLLNKYYVSIITWWDFNNIYNQIITLLQSNSNLSNLFLFPTIWTQMYYYDKWKWIRKYAEFLDENEINYIKYILENTLNNLNIKPKKIRWEIIENRWSQVTYSALWQNAPLEEKQKFDPDKKIRKKIVNEIKNKLKDYEIWIAWTTSIDITKKGLDKSYWIKKIIENLKIKKEEILFIWDAIFPWWNDYPITKVWVDFIKVNDTKDTENIIKSLI